MTAFTYDQLDRMLAGKPHVDMPCPVCGPHARLPLNRRRKVLRLWNPRPGFISWDCRRCGIKGGVGDGSLTRHTDKAPVRLKPDQPVEPDAAALDTMQYAQRLFRSSLPLKDTAAELHLNSRAISLEDAGNLHHAMRFAPMLVLDGRRVCGIVSLFRDILTNEPRGIHRTFLDAAGRKLDRRMLGPTAGAAIKIDPDEDVTMGLHVGEGIETVLAARQLGMRPAWALGSASAIGTFPVLAGLEAIIALGERDEDGKPNKANMKAAVDLGTRYTAAGLEMILADPPAGDMNDALKRVAVQ